MRPEERIGSYLLRREIGGGGIAAVFIAERDGDDRSAATDVVLKVLRPELMDQPEIVSVFLSEPRALMAVEHENTIEVTDVVDTGPHRMFATELLRGRTVTELLKHGALPLARALDIARQVATVLAHAHDVDVVHRNLKPANVFLVRRGGTPDFVKLLELGATRMQSQGEKPVPGTLIGTPAYMAPEQLRQTAGDWRVDMYSFGVLLFELVAGRRPFTGDVAEVVRRHLLEPAPRVSSVAPDVPEALDQLIASCLEKDPAARPPSMHEVSLALAAMADTLAAPAAGEDGPAPSVAVPKNSSGWATVAADATVAPPALALDEDEEASFEGVTGERMAVRDFDTVPSGAPVTEPALAPAPLWDLPDVTADLGSLPRRPRPLWPLVAAAAGGALVVLLIVVAVAGGDDATPGVTPGARPTAPTPPALPTPPTPPDVVPPPPVPASDDGGLSLPPVVPLQPPPAGKATHQVAFGSTPAGAQVWIRMDRKIRLLCTTPCTFALPEGKEVLVELRKDGYSSAQRTIVVAEGARFDGSLRR